MVDTRERTRDQPQLTLLNAFQLHCDGAAVPITLPAQRVLGFLAIRIGRCRATTWPARSGSTRRAARHRQPALGAVAAAPVRRRAGRGERTAAGAVGVGRRGLPPGGRLGATAARPGGDRHRRGHRPRSRGLANCCPGGTTTGCWWSVSGCGSCCCTRWSASARAAGEGRYGAGAGGRPRRGADGAAARERPPLGDPGALGRGQPGRRAAPVPPVPEPARQELRLEPSDQMHELMAELITR